MESRPIHQYDCVALLQPMPAEGLAAGQVGAVVEVYTPDEFEVELLISMEKPSACAPVTAASCSCSSTKL